MPHDFIPRPDGDFLLWVRNFVTQLQNDPDGYQTPADVVQQLATLTDDFATAYAATKTAWRCPSYVHQKNQARRVLEKLARQVAKEIRSRWDMPDQLKVIAGLSVRGPGGYHGRRKRPDAPPRLMVRGVAGPVVTVWLIDRKSGRHARPHRGMMANLFVAVGEHLSGGEYWQFVGACSTEIDVNLSKLKLAPGTRVWLAACWNNRQGAGPMSDPVPARVGDGYVMPRLAA